MRARLIVNADDFGLCEGVDRGIREAARDGIVTSVSVLVANVTRESIRRLRDAAPGVGMGLHVDLTSDLRRPLRGDEDRRVREQFERFVELAGEPPDHLDAHKHCHRGSPATLAALASYGLPVRADRAEVRRTLRALDVPCTDHFVGDVRPVAWWSARRLCDALVAARPGTTELMCHPGWPDGLPAAIAYRGQRVVELRALTAPHLRRRVAALGIELVTFGALRRAELTACA